MAALILLLLLFLPIIPIFLLLTKGSSSKRSPPGSLGLPIVGQSISLLRAMRANTAEQWLKRRTDKYGPVFKLSLFGGTPTIFISGPAANKFIFATESLAPQQPRSLTRILGKRNMMELIGSDHKRVRGAVSQFLRPEVLKQYVGKIDEEVRHHLRTHWVDHQYLTILPLMKRLTFNIICSLLFGIERGTIRDQLINEFTDMLDGIWAVPVNLPFTRFNKSVRASERAGKMVYGIVQEKRTALEEGRCSPHDNLITYLLSLRDGGKERGLTEEEIVHNSMLVLIAGHDTTSIVLTFIIRQLAKDPAVRARVLNEQEEIKRSKGPKEALAWDDLTKMKYSWQVAMEILRMFHPVFGSFRKALTDLEFEGYLIYTKRMVLWVSCMTQMDENIFLEPQEFDPVRFDKQKQSSIPPYCFVAFGGGPRICPGNEFAKLEMLVVMHYIVTLFKWELCCKDDVFSRDPLPAPSKGLPVKLEHSSDLSNL